MWGGGGINNWEHQSDANLNVPQNPGQSTKKQIKNVICND